MEVSWDSWHGYFKCRYCGLHYISLRELRSHQALDCDNAKKVMMVKARMLGHRVDY